MKKATPNLSHIRDVCGFTLVELIVTLIVVGILAVVALPRFTGRADYDAVTLFDKAIAATRYAQKAAVAQNRTVYVFVSAAQLAACFDAGCAARVIDPATGQGLIVDAASTGLTLSSSSSSFTFDGLGRASTSTNVTIGSSPPRTFTVEQETGYVHP